MPGSVNAFYGFSSIMYDRCNPLCSIDLLPCLQFLHEGLPDRNIPDRLVFVLLGGTEMYYLVFQVHIGPHQAKQL